MRVRQQGEVRGVAAAGAREPGVFRPVSEEDLLNVGEQCLRGHGQQATREAAPGLCDAAALDERKRDRSEFVDGELDLKGASDGWRCNACRPHRDRDVTYAQEASAGCGRVGRYLTCIRREDK